MMALPHLLWVLLLDVQFEHMVTVLITRVYIQDYTEFCETATELLVDILIDVCNVLVVVSDKWNMCAYTIKFFG